MLVDLDDRRSGRPTSGAAVAAQWFAQPIFGNTDLEDEEDEEQPMPSSSGRQQAQAKGTAMAKTKAGPISKAGSMTPKVAGAIAAPSQGLLSQAAATAVAEAADSDDADEGSAPSSSSDDASQGMEDDNDDVAQARIDSGAAAAPSGDKSGFEEARTHALTHSHCAQCLCSALPVYGVQMLTVPVFKTSTTSLWLLSRRQLNIAQLHQCPSL